MAVVHDRRVALQTQLASLQNKQSSADHDHDHDHDHDESQVQMIQAQLVSEQAKRAAWDAENARRRHNYLPFCVELLRGMAESGKLPELTKAANDRVALHRQTAMAKRMAQK
jgi:ubiquitin carboxyl-terminal hydrolase L5